MLLSMCRSLIKMLYRNRKLILEKPTALEVEKKRLELICGCDMLSNEQVNVVSVRRQEREDGMLGVSQPSNPETLSMRVVRDHEHVGVYFRWVPPWVDSTVPFCSLSRHARIFFRSVSRRVACSVAGRISKFRLA